ncbi:Hint domain-containing protein [uncultured Sulfitobacter sp.]|uniref:Hint domain-containing protein n=1 Tax=uncultured Sulfitobacter sp. TaxID=191468 RepID=UPI00261338EE|nr:Hint domain-containing protein [uncultured Sulfitobacter sp.]
MANYSLLVFSWNDIFPSLSQTGTENDLVGETFTFTGGGDLVDYQDNDSFSGSFGDHGFVDNRITGTIDGVSVNESLVNPEYAYEIKDSSGTTVGNMYAISKNTANLSDIEAFTFDFQPQGGETYTLSSIDSVPATSYSNLYVCFAAGTLIETCKGPIAVETIKPGDRVHTRDNGLKEILWSGSRAMDYQSLVLHPRSRPILIAAGALGHGIPATPLVVSPQHRVLVSSPIIERMTGQAEIMIPAKKLLGVAGVEQYLPDSGVTYVHILCETHELVNANGTFVETMYLGEQSLNLLGREDYEDIAECHPGLADQMVLHPAAQSGEAFRSKISNLVRRHTSNHHEIVQRGAPRERSAQR